MTIKNGKCHLLKMARSPLYSHGNKIRKEPGTSFRLYYRAKNMTEMFAIQHTSI